MTSGIYQLNFDNQAYYIGQSQDMEARWKQHADKFIKGKAAAKMQSAYDQLGMPMTGIVIECHKDYLDIMETFYIHDQKQYPNCLNTTAPPLDPNIDYTWLYQNRFMLKFSAFQIIQEFVEITQAKEVLEQTHATLTRNFNSKFIEAKAVAELQKGKDKNAKLVVEQRNNLAQAQAKITQLLNRGLWDRIFNHQ